MRFQISGSAGPGADRRCLEVCAALRWPHWFLGRGGAGAELGAGGQRILDEFEELSRETNDLSRSCSDVEVSPADDASPTDEASPTS